MNILDNPSEKHNIELVSVKIHRDLYTDYLIRHPEDVIPILGDLIGDSDREHLVVLNCTAKHQVINYSISSTGYTTGTCVSPADMLRTTILSGASSIFMVHNHPSGDCTPSGDDNTATTRIAACAKLLNLQLIDHIILGGSNGPLFSFYESSPELLTPEVNVKPGEAVYLPEYGLKELTASLSL